MFGQDAKKEAVEVARDEVHLSHLAHFLNRLL